MKDFLLLLALAGSLCHSLKITKVSVPTPMVVGDSGMLECQWVSEGNSVYSLKWYLGLDEFYRWTPAAHPKIKIFAIDKAFHIEEEESAEGRVSIRNVTLAAAGLMRCEISEEPPAFHTQHFDVQLTVIDTPDSRPILTRGKITNYSPYETVTLNCTSMNAKPAATLSFFVNEERANESWIRRLPLDIDPYTTLETAMISMDLPLLPKYTRRGYVSVKCVAKIMKVYWESTDIVVWGQMPQRASSTMEGRASGGILSTKINANVPRIILSLLYWFLH